MILFKTQKDTLLSPLQMVAGIVERRHTLPILSNVLLEKQGDTLQVLASDIEIQITTNTTVSEGQEQTAFTVNARKLQDILRAVPEGQEITFDLDDKRLAVKAGKSRFSLQTLPAADFPRMAEASGAQTHLTLTQGEFKHLLGKTQYAMASQDVRYYLNGLLLLVEGNVLRVVATDGHRLAYSSLALEADLPRHEAILPRKAVLELNRLLADNNDPLEIFFADNQVIFRFGAVTLVTKVIDGKFPDYERVIPTQLKNDFLVERQVLAAALSRAAILTNEKVRGVRVILERNCLRILAANAEQEEAVEELEIDYQGDSLDIGFNITYLQEVLSNLSCTHIKWQFNSANSSSLISIPDNEHFKYVVMPMRI